MQFKKARQASENYFVGYGSSVWLNKNLDIFDRFLVKEG
jgi:hypothetical protein